jgi:diguanylate cyclase (GGDEF)-like protein
VNAPRRQSKAFTAGAPTQPIWSAPDSALAAAGIEGEYVVAKVRLVAMVLLMIAPTYNVFAHGSSMHLAGFFVTLAAALASFAIWLRLRNGEWRPWFGFASSTFDVSMVSLALTSFYVFATPLHALNSTVTFEMYFLALVATSLRYDARICIVVGALVIIQYGTIWAIAASSTDLAFLSVTARAGPYVPVDLATRLLLLGIATLLAVTLVRRAQRLLYLAARDRLTGLYNRGHFDRALISAFDQATRDRSPLTLALLDVDHFKKINDEHGHYYGDIALQQVADLLSTSMRKTDVVARYGGEEFVILMPNTSRDAALARIDALRLELLETPVSLPDGQQLTIGFSAGIAGSISEPDVTDTKSMVDVADRRLLAAKRAGRGRCLASDAAAGIFAS